MTTIPCSRRASVTYSSFVGEQPRAEKNAKADINNVAVFIIDFPDFPKILSDIKATVFYQSLPEKQSLLQVYFFQSTTERSRRLFFMNRPAWGSDAFVEKSS